MSNRKKIISVIDIEDNTVIKNIITNKMDIQCGDVILLTSGMGWEIKYNDGIWSPLKYDNLVKVLSVDDIYLNFYDTNKINNIDVFNSMNTVVVLRIIDLFMGTEEIDTIDDISNNKYKIYTNIIKPLINGDTIFVYDFKNFKYYKVLLSLDENGYNIRLRYINEINKDIINKLNDKFIDKWGKL